MTKPIDEIEDQLDELQKLYLEEEDENLQLTIEFKFTLLLDEATECDGILRTARGVTIHNWVREEF